MKSFQPKEWIIILSFSFIAFFIHGYQFAVSDQEIFIPYILKSATPSLFLGDALFNQSSVHLSIFYPLVGLLTKFFDIQIIFFIGYLIFQFAFFTGIYRLSKILLKNERLAYFSLLPFLLPKFIGGTATQTFDLFFGYRSVGVIFLIFFLSFLLEHRYAKSLIVASVGTLFHPASIVPSVLNVFALYLLNSKSKTKDCLKIISASLLLAVSSYIVLGKNFFYTIFSKNEIWYSIIKFRDAYVFTSTWQLLGWAAFFIYIVLVVVFLNELKKDIRYFVKTICLVALAVFLINAILLEVLRFPGFAQFQLVRSITPVVYIALAISPLFLTFKNKILRILGLFAFIFLSLNLFYFFLIMTTLFIVARLATNNKSQSDLSKYHLYLISTIILTLYFFLNLTSYSDLQEKIQFPKKISEWISLQKWVLQNTDVSAKILTPPASTGFRIFSQRPIVGDIKDGAVVIYSRDYAYYWDNLMRNLKDYDSFHDQDYIHLNRLYNFNYVITDSQNKLNFKLMYKNEKFSVYKI